MEEEYCLHTTKCVKTKNDLFLFSSKKWSLWESCCVFFNFQHKMALLFFNSYWEFSFEKQLVLQFWIRSWLLTNFISTCHTFVTLEKCLVCSADTGIVLEDFGNLILFTVTSKYHQTLVVTAYPRELDFHMCIFTVLTYACCFSYIFILLSDEQFSCCVLIPQNAKVPWTLWRGTGYVQICVVAMLPCSSS